jgi:hypothetical protein
MKVMEDNHLATYCHSYPATNDNQLGVTSAPFTTDDKKLQLGRSQNNKKSLNIPTEYSEVINRRKTDKQRSTKHYTEN